MLKSISDKKKKPKMINIRVSEDELKAIHEQAEKYTSGNITAWIKYTALNYRPKKSELHKGDQ